MSREVYVLGVGMTKFEKPGSRVWDYFAKVALQHNLGLGGAAVVTLYSKPAA